VDSTVTGSDAGTCRAPKYPLLPLFLDTVFPKVEALVGVGGRYAGYVPIIQGDNADRFAGVAAILTDFRLVFQHLLVPTLPAFTISNRNLNFQIR
jgi:hypothetical protein